MKNDDKDSSAELAAVGNDTGSSPTETASRPPNLADAAEMLWTVVANVNGGDWTQQSQEWQDAAARWRDYYFAACPAFQDGTGNQATQEPAGSVPSAAQE